MENIITINDRNLHYEICKFWVGGFEFGGWAKKTIFYEEMEEVKVWSWSKFKFVKENSPKIIFTLNLDILSPNYSSSYIKEEITKELDILIKKENRAIEISNDKII